MVSSSGTGSGFRVLAPFFDFLGGPVGTGSSGWVVVGWGSSAGGFTPPASVGAVKEISEPYSDRSLVEWLVPMPEARALRRFLAGVFFDAVLLARVIFYEVGRREEVI